MDILDYFHILAIVNITATNMGVLILAMISWIWHQKHRQQKQKEISGIDIKLKSSAHQKKTQQFIEW